MRSGMVLAVSSPASVSLGRSDLRHALHYVTVHSGVATSVTGVVPICGIIVTARRSSVGH